MYCKECGTPNGSEAKFCVNCGVTLASAGLQSEPQGRSDPTMGSDSAWQRTPSSRIAPRESSTGSRDLYALVIGNSNQARYLDKFEQFDRDGKVSAGWHWPALFVTLYWLLYRKSWLNALLYAIVPGIAMSILALLTKPLGDIVSGLATIVGAVLFIILPPMYADAAYYRLVKSRIASVMSTNKSPEVQRALLAAKGGTSVLAVVLVSLFIPMFIGILAAVSIPAYQDYTVRAKTAVALSEAKAVGGAVGEFYEINKRLPGTLLEAGVQPRAGDKYHFEEVQLNAANGVLRVVMPQSAGGSVGGKYFELTPSDDNGRVIWSCTAGTVPPKHLPLECRGG